MVGPSVLVFQVGEVVMECNGWSGHSSLGNHMFGLDQIEG